MGRRSLVQLLPGADTWSMQHNAPKTPGVPRTALAAGVLCICYIIWQITRIGGSAHVTWIGDAFFVPADLLAAAASVGAAVRSRGDLRRARSWGFVAVAMLGYVTGDLLQVYSENIRHVADHPDFPDAIFYVFFFIGLTGFAAKRQTSIRRWMFSLDTAIITFSAGSCGTWLPDRQPRADILSTRSSTQSSTRSEISFCCLPASEP
jgi:hypothetical protein